MARDQPVDSYRGGNESGKKTMRSCQTAARRQTNTTENSAVKQRTLNMKDFKRFKYVSNISDKYKMGSVLG